MKTSIIHLLAALGATAANAANAADRPGLKLKTTTNYEFIWNDRGSGASDNVAIWLGKGDDEYRPLGSTAFAVYDQPDHHPSLVVGGDPDENDPAVKSPVDYTLMWKDAGSGADKDVSLWRPVAPEGYVAVGDLAQSGWMKPDINRVWCLRKDLVKKSKYYNDALWNDRNSKSYSDVSIWDIYSPYNDIPVLIVRGFVTSKSWSKPSEDLALIPDISKVVYPENLGDLRNTSY